MTRSRFTEGFNQLRRVIGKVSFVLCAAVFLLRFVYLGDYEIYARWPHVPFYRDDVVLAFFFMAMGFYFVRVLCTAPISAAESILGGFLSFEPELPDQGGFNPDDISPSARFSIQTFERGIRWIMDGFQYVRWILFIIILWKCADSADITRFVDALSLFGSPSVMGYASGLLLFAILWLLFFPIQGFALAYFEHRLNRFVGDDVAEEAYRYLQQRVLAKGLPPRFAERWMR
jgi:hypothetical protein